MPTVYDFPIEVISRIFTNIVEDRRLKKGELAEFLRQCASMKAFTSVARVYLFETIRVCCPRKSLSSLIRAPHLGQFVRVLHIKLNQDYGDLSADFFIDAFSPLINVHTLSIEELPSWHTLPPSLKTGLERLMSMKNFRRLALHKCSFNWHFTDLREMLKLCSSKLEELSINHSRYFGRGEDNSEPVPLPHLQTLRFLAADSQVREKPFLVCPNLKVFEADVITGDEIEVYTAPSYLPQKLEFFSLTIPTSAVWDNFLRPVDIEMSVFSVKVHPFLVDLGETLKYIARLIKSLPHPKALRRIKVVIGITGDYEPSYSTKEKDFEALSKVVHNLKNTGKLESFEVGIREVFDYFTEQVYEKRTKDFDGDMYSSGEDAVDELEVVRKGFSKEIEDGLIKVLTRAD